MVMMNCNLREHAVVLTVVVLYLTIFSGSNGRNLVLSQRNNGSSNNSGFEGEYGAQSKSRTMDIVRVAYPKIDTNSQQSIQQRDPKENSEEEAPTSPSSSIAITLPGSMMVIENPLKLTVATGLRQNSSVKMFSIDKDTLEISSINPTTYRPSVTPINIAQERERKLMNVLAARRNALHNGRFRTRIGTTGRTATVASMETTSRTPTDPRSICIRNCTKNFTRRTTASCMRQCSNFSRTSLTASNTTAPSSGLVVVRASSRTGLVTQTSDRDNNEILFTDESAHGLFVVAKEQNDTLNHIPDVTKNEKFRSRNKLLSTSTISPTSIEEDDIQPYLYFGKKLPPIKPATLTIISVSEEHPKLLEVSASQINSTTPTTLGPTSTLSAVERSRSRYKYRDRGYISVRRSPIRTIVLDSVNPSETKSRLLLSNSNNNSTIKKEASAVIGLVSANVRAENVTERIIAHAHQIDSTQSSVFHSPDSIVPLIKKEFSDEEESSQSFQYKNSSETQEPSYPESILTSLTSNLTDIQNNYSVQSSTSSIHVLGAKVSKGTPVNMNFQRTKPTSLRPFIDTTIATISKTVNITTTPIINMTTSIPTFVPTTTERPKSIIHEDIEKLRALGPNLTKVIEDDQNIVIFINHTTPRPFSSFETNNKDVTENPTFILGTTVMTSIRSTVNPHIKNPFSTQLNKSGILSYVGIIETTPIEKLTRNHPPITSGTDIKSTYVANESDVSQEMRRVNIATMVLAGIGIIPLCALVICLVRSYLLRRSGKNEEDFDVCITDQQPISPVKKLDSKYRSKNEEKEDEADQHTVYTSHHHPTHVMPMKHSKITKHNNRYDERCSVTSDQEFDRSNIRLKSLLGEGNFGQVWKAEADDLSGHFGATRIVAVKTIRKCSAQSGLKEEADIMRKLGSHQNVVTLLGACVESEPHMLIMEYAMRGRLLSLLRAARSATNILPASVPGGRSLTPLSPRTLGGFALDIVSGMEYIADKRIVHRDLAARNVLLDHNGVCKICDFGMSIDLDAECKRKEADNNNKNELIHSNTKKNKFDFGSRFIISHLNSNFNGPNSSPSLGKDVNERKSNIHGQGHGHDSIGRRPALPIRWMAPEALQYHIFTTETDVWAFGIVLWEIATLGSTPYANLTGREVIRRVPNGLRPELPKEGRHEFYNLMTRCWHKDPHLRPSFTYARQEISRTMHKWDDDDSAASDYMDVSGFSEDLEHGIVYFNHRISEFECEI